MTIFGSRQVLVTVAFFLALMAAAFTLTLLFTHAIGDTNMAILAAMLIVGGVVRAVERKVSR